MKIPGWTKIENSPHTLYKWRHDETNSFIEISNAKDYGYVDGYILVMWSNHNSRPAGLAGEKTLSKIYDAAVKYMKAHR